MDNTNVHSMTLRRPPTLKFHIVLNSCLNPKPLLGFELVRLQSGLPTGGRNLFYAGAMTATSAHFVEKFREVMSEMRFYFVIAPTNLVVMFCLVFTSGCQNESAATKSVTPPQVAFTSPSGARALDGSDQGGQGDSIELTFKKDELVRKAMNQESFAQDSFEQANWEQDIPQESEPSRATEELMVDSTLGFESEGLGKLNADTSRVSAMLQKASER